MKITTLRTTSNDCCPDERSCVSIHDLDIHPERRYVITKREIDSRIIAAFAHLAAQTSSSAGVPSTCSPRCDNGPPARRRRTRSLPR